MPKFYLKNYLISIINSTDLLKLCIKKKSKK